MEKKKSAISVLMSTYNETPEHVKEAIDSILNQTYEDFELIIINDNPNDKKIDELIRSIKDERIQYFRNKENIGLAESMNLAARLATNNIIARMDSDDIAIHDRFEKQINLLLNDECDLVCSRYSIINEKGALIDATVGYQGGNEELNKLVQLSPQKIIHHPTVMFKRDLFDQVSGYRNFPCAQDLDLWMRMAEVGCRIRCLDDVLLKYRKNGSSISHKKHFQQQLTLHYSYKLSVERIQSGKDSFSQENYNEYLKNNGLGNAEKEKQFERYFQMLKYNDNLMIRLLKRLRVFLAIPSLREYYLLQKKKNRLLRAL